MKFKIGDIVQYVSDTTSCTFEIINIINIINLEYVVKYTEFSDHPTMIGMELKYGVDFIDGPLHYLHKQYMKKKEWNESLNSILNS